MLTIKIADLKPTDRVRILRNAVTILTVHQEPNGDYEVWWKGDAQFSYGMATFLPTTEFAKVGE
jgi:hypothetical protein